MSCPTCSAMMEMIAQTNNGSSVHWCPRCGTYLCQNMGIVQAPQLVERCRQLTAWPAFRDGFDLWQALDRLGIIEAIHTAEERKRP